MYNYETLKILLNSRDFSHVRFKGDIMKLLKRVVIKFNEIFTLGKCRVIFDIPP